MNMINEMIGKNKKIQDLITEIANKTEGITSDQIAKAREMYQDDPRSLEEIRAELEKFSAKITRETKQREEMYKKMFGSKDNESTDMRAENTATSAQPLSNQAEENNESEITMPLQQNVNEGDKLETETPDLTDEGYYKTEYLDLDDIADFDLSDGVNYPEPVLERIDQNMPTSVNSQTELDSMFAPDEHQALQDQQQKTEEKGKTMVKTANEGNNINNNSGYSSALNLSFMLSTVSILGLFLASLLILISRAIG